MVSQRVQDALGVSICMTILSPFFEWNLPGTIWLQLLLIFFIWFSAYFIVSLFLDFLKLKWKNRKE